MPFISPILAVKSQQYLNLLDKVEIDFKEGEQEMGEYSQNLLLYHHIY